MMTGRSAPEAARFEREECRIMRDRLLRKLNARMPWLGEWLGNRLDLEVPAYMVSLTAHAVLLIGLASGRPPGAPGRAA